MGVDKMGKIIKLIKSAKKYRTRYIIGIFFLLFVDIIQLIPPKLMGLLTDSISKGTATKALILKYIFCILLISILMVISRFLWRIYIIGTSRYLEYDIRNKLFRHFQKLSSNFYNQNKTGDLMALATNDINAVRMALGQGIINLTDSIVLTLTTLIIMLSINVKLTLIALIPLPFVALVSLKFGKSIHNRFLKVQKAFSKLTDVVQENFSGIRVIKSFVQEELEFKKFTDENEKNFNTNMDLIKVWSLFFPLIQFISSLSFVILLGLGGYYVLSGNITLGDFVTFNMYLGSLVWPMMAVGWVINMIQRGLASYDRLEVVFKTKPEIYDRNIIKVNSLIGDIDINNLTFKYPGSDKPALSNISLHVSRNRTLGILGRTGSGKTTLVNLLVHLYNVEDGRIFINGVDINRIPLSVLRENIGFVPQDSFLFSSNVSENINLALESFNNDKITSSAKAACIYDDIMDFNDKFDTIVGERGVTLSGGQKQRISISRALIKNPEILIFDDCLSAVDAKTEDAILKNLKIAMKDRTSIIISHRISAIKDSDLIAVFDNGKIVETGTHEELIKNDGLYYSIYEKQQLEEKIQEEEA